VLILGTVNFSENIELPQIPGRGFFKCPRGEHARLAPTKKIRKDDRAEYNKTTEHLNFQPKTL
jgi:hypothetical protein